MKRLVASLSLDLDNEWSYQRTHGDPSWTEYPTYISEVVPLASEILDDLGLTITWFIVGRDADDERNLDTLAALGASEHEMGNHSYEHLPWLHRYERAALADELRRADEAIERATGKRPVGFRGPGFSLSPDTLEVIDELGYAFDATTLPTWIGPFARRYYFRGTQDLTEDEREQRSLLFGRFRDVFQRNAPYRWTDVPSGSITEIPVTTFPGLRVPFHISYLLYVAERSPGLADAYLAAGLRACRMRGSGPSVLLHPLDFLGGDEVTSLAFFPGMGTKGAIKRERVHGYLERLADAFEVMPMGAHAAAAGESGLRARTLD